MGGLQCAVCNVKVKVKVKGKGNSDGWIPEQPKQGWGTGRGGEGRPGEGKVETFGGGVD